MIRNVTIEMQLLHSFSSNVFHDTDTKIELTQYVQFQAIPTGGGSSPILQWKRGDDTGKIRITLLQLEEQEPGTKL